LFGGTAHLISSPPWSKAANGVPEPFAARPERLTERQVGLGEEREVQRPRGARGGGRTDQDQDEGKATTH
jgi:hypothetical protein